MNRSLMPSTGDHGSMASSAVATIRQSCCATNLHLSTVNQPGTYSGIGIHAYVATHNRYEKSRSQAALFLDYGIGVNVFVSVGVCDGPIVVVGLGVNVSVMVGVGDVVKCG